MSELRVVATGLRFPEGPVAMRDGSVVLVEIERQTVSRVRRTERWRWSRIPAAGRTAWRSGRTGRSTSATTAASVAAEDEPAAAGRRASDYTGGRIERVDPETGAVSVLYDRCRRHRLRGPNDIVFDAHGGCYFTDLGKAARATAIMAGYTTRWPTGRRSSRWRTRS